MRWEQEQRQRLYNETAGIIMSWSYQNKITSDEMHLLFNLLDEIVVNQNYPDLHLALKRWRDAGLDEKLSEIVLATLMAADFKKKQEMDNLVQLIEDLIADTE